MTDQDLAPLTPPPAKRSRLMEAFLMLFVATGIVRTLLPQDSPTGLFARRVDDWINLGLLAAAAVEGALMMKRTRTPIPRWVHVLAVFGLASMGSFAWLDRELWSSAPLHYAARALVGPLTVYAAFFSYAIIWRDAQLPHEAALAEKGDRFVPR